MSMQTYEDMRYGKSWAGHKDIVRKLIYSYACYVQGEGAIWKARYDYSYASGVVSSIPAEWGHIEIQHVLNLSSFIEVAQPQDFWTHLERTGELLMNGWRIPASFVLDATHAGLVAVHEDNGKVYFSRTPLLDHVVACLKKWCYFFCGYSRWVGQQ